MTLVHARPCGDSRAPYKPKSIAEANLPKQRQSACLAAGEAGKALYLLRCADRGLALYPQTVVPDSGFRTRDFRECGRVVCVFKTQRFANQFGIGKIKMRLLA